MILEKGDYFVVTRGFQLHDISPLFSMFGNGESWKNPQKDSSPRYDRSYHDVVFLAREVCDCMVAAQRVTPKPALYQSLVESLNLNEIEVMTVTKEYVRACIKGENPRSRK